MKEDSEYFQLTKECVRLRFENGVLIDGLGPMRFISGPGILEILDALSETPRSADDLAARYPGIHPPVLRSALRILREQGLVTHIDVGLESDVSQSSNQAHFFLRRLASVAGMPHKALSACSVVIVSTDADRTYAGHLQELLLSSGLKSVSTAGQDLKSLSGHQADLYISVACGLEPATWHQTLDAWCRATNHRWLRIAVALLHNTIDFGPLFLPGEIPCYSCFSHTHAGNGGDGRSLGDHPTELPGLAMGLASVEIIHLLAEVASPLRPGRARRLDMATWRFKELAGLRVPGCLRCFGPGTQEPGTQARALLLPQAFEDALSLPVSPQSDPAAEKERLRIGAQLSHQSKRMSLCPEHKLPDVPLSDILSGSTTITAAHLANALQFTVGFRNQGNVPSRWTASAGNLGSVQIYFCAQAVQDLPDGMSFYQPATHSLAHLRWRSNQLSPPQLWERLGLHSRPAVILIFTGDYQKLSRKYGPFGYKLLNFDAGVAAAQLSMLTAGMGLHTAFLNDWPDDLLQQQLRVRCPGEQITAVAVLSGDAAQCLPTPPTKNRQPMSVEYSAATVGSILALLQADARSSEEEFVPCPLRTIPAPGALNLQTLMTRRSVRSFSPRLVTWECIEKLLAAAAHCDTQLHADDPPLDFYVFCPRGSEMGKELRPPGLWQSGFLHNNKLTRRPTITPELATALAGSLYVQNELGHAPAHVWITADLSALRPECASIQYRTLLFRAGVAAQQIWATALQLGLDGTIVAGLVHGAARQSLGFDGLHTAALLSVPLGYKFTSGRSPE